MCSDPLKGDFLGSMYVFVELRNGLDVWLPSIFLLIKSVFLSLHVQWNLVTKALSKSGVCASGLIISSGRLFDLSWALHMLPLNHGCSQKWNSSKELLGPFNVLDNFVLICDVSIKYERSCINRSLEGALCRSHGAAHAWLIEHTHGLYSFSGHRVIWCILSKELGVGHSWIVKSYVVIHWTIEVFSCCRVSLVIVFGALHVKVGDPA